MWTRLNFFSETSSYSFAITISGGILTYRGDLPPPPKTNSAPLPLFLQTASFEVSFLLLLAFFRTVCPLLNDIYTYKSVCFSSKLPFNLLPANQMGNFVSVAKQEMAYLHLTSLVQGPPCLGQWARWLRKGFTCVCSGRWVI